MRCLEVTPSVALIVAAIGCRPNPPPTSQKSAASAASEPPGIDRPVTREALVKGSFVVHSDLWSVVVPEGDPLRFLPDGQIENVRAGLRGPWEIIDDSTVQIGRVVFRHRRAERDLFAPIQAPPIDSVLPPGTRLMGTLIVAVRR